MRFFGILCLALAAILMMAAQNPQAAEAAPGATARLTTIALRVHHLDAMVAFYTEAFGVQFREVDTFGISSRFGELSSGITLKLVPIRAEAEFEDYPTHQLGFEVADVEKVISLALRHGGRQDGELLRDGDRLHGAVRDPDGNTIELYGPR